MIVREVAAKDGLRTVLAGVIPKASLKSAILTKP